MANVAIRVSIGNPALRAKMRQKLRFLDECSRAQSAPASKRAELRRARRPAGRVSDRRVLQDGLDDLVESLLRHTQLAQRRHPRARGQSCESRPARRPAAHRGSRSATNVDRVRQHHRVRLRVRRAEDAHRRLADGVVHGEAGAAHRVAGEDRGQRQVGAPRLVVAEPGLEQLDRAQRRHRGHRAPHRAVERLDRVRERVHRAGGEVGHRLRGHQPRLGHDERRPHEGELVDAGGHPMEARHRRARRASSGSPPPAARRRRRSPSPRRSRARRRTRRAASRPPRSRTAAAASGTGPDGTCATRAAPSDQVPASRSARSVVSSE